MGDTWHFNPTSHVNTNILLNIVITSQNARVHIILPLFGKLTTPATATYTSSWFTCWQKPDSSNHTKTSGDMQHEIHVACRNGVIMPTVHARTMAILISKSSHRETAKGFKAISLLFSRAIHYRPPLYHSIKTVCIVSYYWRTTKY